MSHQQAPRGQRPPAPSQVPPRTHSAPPVMPAQPDASQVLPATDGAAGHPIAPAAAGHPQFRGTTAAPFAPYPQPFQPTNQIHGVTGYGPPGAHGAPYFFPSPQAQMPLQAPPAGAGTPPSRPAQKRERKVLTIKRPDTKEVVVPPKKETPASTPPANGTAAPAAAPVPAAAATTPAAPATPTQKPGSSTPAKERKALAIVKPTADDKPAATAGGKAATAKPAEAKSVAAQTASSTTTKPAEAAASKPVSKPAEKPAKPDTKPAEVAKPDTKPAEVAKPAEETKKPKEETKKPAEETNKPAEEDAKPAEEDAKTTSDGAPVYPEGTYNPATKTGAKVYPMEFMRVFRDVCQGKPKWSPEADRLMAAATAASQHPQRQLSNSGSRRPPGSGGGGVQNLDWMKSPQKRAPRPGQRPGPGGQAPKVITRTVEKIELQKSENAWAGNKVKSVSEDEQLLLKAMGVLNKLTLEKFDKLSDQLIDIGSQLPDEAMSKFIDKIFTKALDEQFFSGMYARLCRKMSDAKEKLPQFRKLLLNACQREFQKDRDAEEASEEQKGKEQTEEEVEAQMKAKRHMIGNIKFIGELYRQDMVAEVIIHRDCVTKLLAKPDADEDMLECLCKLLETAGGKLAKGKDAARIQDYMKKIRQLTQRKGLSSRVKFMLQDLLELEQRKWVARRAVAGPTTLNEVHKAAEASKQREKAAAATVTGRLDNRRGGGGRPGSRGASREYRVPPQQDEWQSVSSGSTGRRNPKDIARLKKSMQQSSTSSPEVRLGPSRRPGMGMQGKSGSGSSSAAPSPRKNKFDGLLDADSDAAATSEPETETETPSQPLSESEQKKLIGTLEEYFNLKDTKEAIECIAELERPGVFAAFVSLSVSRTIEGKEAACDDLCKLFKTFKEQKKITAAEFSNSLSEPLAALNDIALDAPMAPKLFAKFVALGLLEGLLEGSFLAVDTVQEARPGRYALELVLDVLASIRTQSDEATMLAKVGDLPVAPIEYLKEGPRRDEDFQMLLERKDLKVLGDAVPTKAAAAAEPKVDVALELKAMLRSGKNNPDILKWLQSSGVDPKLPSFVRTLALAVIGAVAQSSTCRPDASKDKSPPEDLIKKEKAQAEERLLLVQKHVESNAALQLEVVYAVHEYATDPSFVFPPGFLDRWFTYLYDFNVVDEEVFITWVDDKRKCNQKGAAVQQASDFLTMLRDGEEEDDNEEEA